MLGIAVLDISLGELSRSSDAQRWIRIGAAGYEKKSGFQHHSITLGRFPSSDQ